MERGIVAVLRAVHGLRRTTSRVRGEFLWYTPFRPGRSLRAVCALDVLFQKRLRFPGIHEVRDMEMELGYHYLARFMCTYNDPCGDNSSQRGTADRQTGTALIMCTCSCTTSPGLHFHIETYRIANKRLSTILSKAWTTSEPAPRMALLQLQSVTPHRDSGFPR